MESTTRTSCCIYSIPPDDGLQICPKHVEVDWRNKRRINIYLSDSPTWWTKFLFYKKFISCLYMFRAHLLIIRRSKLHYTASGIITPICDDTRGYVMQFWPLDDEHMCSKHVEAWNKLIVKQKFCASIWLITEINILRCMISKTINILRCRVSKTINILRCTVNETINILRCTVCKTSKWG